MARNGYPALFQDSATNTCSAYPVPSPGRGESQPTKERKTWKFGAALWGSKLNASSLQHHQSPPAGNAVLGTGPFGNRCSRDVSTPGQGPVAHPDQEIEMFNPRTVLVVEDEPDILELYRYSLGRGGFQVTTAATGEEGLCQITEAVPDAVILDWMLPGMEGIDLCRMIRKHPRTRMIPVIMVTAKEADTEIVAGLEAGADDYLVKPFRQAVLLARIEALLRRASQAEKSAGCIVRGGLKIDREKHQAILDGELLDLTNAEMSLITMLAEKTGWVLTRSQIMTSVYGCDYEVSDRAVDVQVVGLRKKLGSAADMVETVRGIGYRFRERPADS